MSRAAKAEIGLKNSWKPKQLQHVEKKAIYLVEVGFENHTITSLCDSLQKCPNWASN
jgi:hypothetical protein